MLTLVGKVVDVIPDCRSDMNRSRKVGYIHVESLHKTDPDRIYVEVDASSPYHPKLPMLNKGDEIVVKFQCRTRRSDKGEAIFNNLHLISVGVAVVQKETCDLLKL